MEGKSKLRYLLLPLCLAGCAKAPEAGFPNWISSIEGPKATSETADKALLDAALDAERRAGPDATRVSFTPGRLAALAERIAPSTDAALRAVERGGAPANRFGSPFEALPGQTGWELIGRAMVYQIELALAGEDRGKAIGPFLSTVRYGLALTEGSATDASLGFHIVDEAVNALAPTMGLMSAAELRRLGTGLESRLAAMPAPEPLVENERKSMRFAVQAVQDAYRQRKLGLLTDQLGKGVEPAVVALERLHGKDSQKRADYFEAFAREADVWADRYRREFRLNARQRAEEPEFEFKGDRPWRRFASHFFAAMDPLPEIRERSVCRLRLAGLQALLLAECLANGSAPGSLTGIPKSLTTDPYSGYALVYRPEGRHFELYSVGPDLKDDGGEASRDLSIEP